MSTKTLSSAVLALLMGVVITGCASETTTTTTTTQTVTVVEVKEETDEETVTVVETTETPDEDCDSDEAQAYTRKVLTSYIRKGQYEEAYNWKIPEGYGMFAKSAAEEERERICVEELYPRWAAALIDGLRVKVIPLVDAYKYEEAREVIWRLPITGCKPVDVLVHEGRAQLMNEIVNIKEWTYLEPILRAKIETYIEEGRYTAALKYLSEYPRERTYTSLFDDQIAAVCLTLTTMGIPEEKLIPAQEEAKALIRQAFADATEAYETVSFTTGEEPDFSKYEASLEELRRTLIKYDCEETKADGVVAALRKTIEPLLAEYCVSTVQTTTTTTLVSLGITQLNAKIDALVIELSQKIEALIAEKKLAEIEAAMEAASYEEARQLAIQLNRIDLLTEALIAEVRLHVAEKEWDKARHAIRDYVDFGCAEIDAAIYLVRIGLLNCEVNPVQKDAMLAEMLAKYTQMVEAGELLETRDWLMNYKLVDDCYPEIDSSIKEIATAIINLGIAEELTTQAMAETRISIQELLDARKGSWDPIKAYEEAKAKENVVELDLVELDKALLVLAESLLDQSNNDPDALARISVIREWANKVAEANRDPMNGRTIVSITTEEMNGALVAQREELLHKLDLEITREKEAIAEKERAEAYQRLLDSLDKAVGLETQITVAEDAIARGLPTVSMGLHTVLGDYARAFRLLRNKAELTAEQKASILVGAAYLNQPTVFTWAIDLGADVNAIAPRDPLARPAVLVAIQAGNVALIRAAAAAEANMAATDANGDTALHYAVRNGDANIIRLALNDTDVNAVNKEGCPAIVIAATRNQVDRVQQLIDAGADVNLANKAGYTTLDIACAAGARDVLDILVKADAKITPKALVLAAANDRLAVAQWLVARGEDVNATGVMETAKGATYDYLVSQGGRPQGKSCLEKTLYFPEELATIEKAKAELIAKDPLARKAEAEAKKAEAEARLAEIAVKKAEAAEGIVDSVEVTIEEEPIEEDYDEDEYDEDEYDEDEE